MEFDTASLEGSGALKARVDLCDALTVAGALQLAYVALGVVGAKLLVEQRSERREACALAELVGALAERGSVDLGPRDLGSVDPGSTDPTPSGVSWPHPPRPRGRSRGRTQGTDTGDGQRNSPQSGGRTQGTDMRSNRMIARLGVLVQWRGETVHVRLSDKASEALARLVPEPQLQNALLGAIYAGREPGGFVFQVLADSGSRAYAAADDHNKPHIPGMWQWLFSYAPAATWGSAERVIAWLDAERTVKSIEGVSDRA